MTVFVCTIQHQAGPSIYASESQQPILDVLEQWARDRWERKGVPGNPDIDTVVTYFSHVEEGYSIDEVELI